MKRDVAIRVQKIGAVAIGAMEMVDDDHEDAPSTKL